MKPALLLPLLLATSLAAGCASLINTRDPQPSAPELEVEAPAPVPVKVEPVVPTAPILTAPAVTSTNAVATAEDPKRKAAFRLMDAIGIDRSMMSLIQTTTAPYKANLPRVPPAFWTELEKSISPAWMLDRLVEETTAVYTPEEIAQICEFLESPLGKKYLQNERLLNERNMMHAGTFSRVLNKEIEKQLRLRKYIH